MTHRIPTHTWLVTAVVSAAVAGLATSSTALAAGCPDPHSRIGGPQPSVYSNCTPGWELTARSYPTYYSPTPPPEGTPSGLIAVDVLNVGASAAGCTLAQGLREEEAVRERKLPAALCFSEEPESNAIVVTDTLPPGIRAVDAGSFHGQAVEPEINHEQWACTGNAPGGLVKGASVVTCKNKAVVGERGESLPIIAGGGGNPTRSVAQGIFLDPEVGITVQVQPGAGEHETNHVTIAGGGAVDAASAESPVTVSAASPPFGVVGWDGWFSNADGTIDTQAGSHPYLGTFSFDVAEEAGGAGIRASGGELRNVEIGLPPGLVGNPAAVPQCTRQQFDYEVCPPDTQVGVGSAYFTVLSVVGFPIFNLTPPPGVPAQLGFIASGVHTFINAAVRSGSDYGITTHTNNIVQKEAVHVVTTLWGDPSDPTHNIWRFGADGGCQQKYLEEPGNRCFGTEFVTRTPFFTLPTSCGTAQPFTIRATNWPLTATSEAEFKSHDSSGEPEGYTGCEKPVFGPELSVSPESANADTASGLALDVKQPLAGFGDVAGTSSAALRHASGSAPGLVVNPGQAAGLQACPETEAATGIGTEGPAHCPAASKIGTVRIKSPLLEAAPEKELEGEVFLLQSNPPTVHVLVAASGDGQYVKLPGTARLDTATGKLEAIFGEEPAVEAEDPFLRGRMMLPQLPASDFKITFDGGAKAAVDTSPHCGTYTTENVDFTPWSSPFGADFKTSAAFALTAGPSGGPCPSSPLPFAPALTAGVDAPLAGGFTGFTTFLQRGDGQKRIEKLSVTTPEGVAALISSVPLCPEPQASLGTCPAASHVGHSVVTSGAGPDPLVVPQPGEPESGIYLTGPYEGAPFGLSIVTPIIAGPFNLGTIVDRAKIEVDPHTALVTVTTDPLPPILKGVPTDLRSIEAVIDRPGFLFNPTSCGESSVTGTATGEGAPGQPEPGVTVALSSRFQVGGCRALLFTPKLSLAAGAHASKKNGQSLTVKFSYPHGALGSQAWFNEVKLVIPKQLPARLSTIQQACPAATFEANRAACPKHSKIGSAVVHTQVLPVPLEGPVYFVSHGGAKFPDVVMLLSGDNVNITLTGETLIKNGVTSATFRNIPDLPFETVAVSLPAGEYGEFGAYASAKHPYSFCGSKLKVPTLLKASNGLEIHASTPISISGCPKPHKTTKHSKKASRNKHKK